MMNTLFPVETFSKISTPFYYYDIDLLKETLESVKKEAARYEGFNVHYAIKANFNPKLLKIICEAELGADCVSGGEVEAALGAGIDAGKIVFAGVGKTDSEIELSLEAQIFCFNVESFPEMEVINHLAAKRGETAQIAIRVNPNVEAHTHANITTGLAENKFGINLEQLGSAIEKAQGLENIKLIGLHFHIGSQILIMDDFVALCSRINELQLNIEKQYGLIFPHLNVGGGLGIRYDKPDKHSIPNFAGYFATYARHLRLMPGQQLHFELGRSIVAQCGNLITRVTYVKKGTRKEFVIVDAGMNDLVRPALYQAQHVIENITSNKPEEMYDVVGPICESSDVFDRDIRLPKTERGDILVLRSAGAYGEAMAFGYNCRKLAPSYLSNEL